MKQRRHPCGAFFVARDNAGAASAAIRIFSCKPTRILHDGCGTVGRGARKKTRRHRSGQMSGYACGRDTNKKRSGENGLSGGHDSRKDRKSVGKGKSVSVSVDLGGSLDIKNKKRRINDNK